MGLFGLFLQVGILWFLITLFTGSTNSDQSLRETWIVVIGMLIVGLLTRFLLPGVLGFASVLINVVALYVLVDKVCGASRKATIRICVWYFGITFLIWLVGFGFEILSEEPVPA